MEVIANHGFILLAMTVAIDFFMAWELVLTTLPM